MYKNYPIVLVYLAIFSVRKLQGTSGSVTSQNTALNIKQSD